jgi:hypothetical protein
MQIKSIFLRAILYFHVFTVGISAISAQSINAPALTELHFPKPSSKIFNPNEIRVIDSLMNCYVVPKNFQGDMVRFAKDDSVNNRTHFDVVFTGSSSFTKWKSLPVDMAPIPVINRGFGGSKVLDMVYFSDSYLYKLQPKLIFVYVENDITMPKVATIKLLFSYLEQVYHSKLPKSKIVFCGIKKSILRKAHWAKVDEVNNFLEFIIAKRKNCGYLDMNTSLLNEKGLSSGEFFLADSLHVNAKGYEKWVQIVKPRLEKEYKRLD